jgi:3-mercaptopyruvate sulfurtransferase SseA
MNLSKTRLLIALTGLAASFSISAIKAISTSASAVTSLAQASDDARRVTPDEVRDLLKQKKAVLVDVRGVEAYKTGHIKGALSIPFSEIGERAKELPRDKLIVAYCS